MNTPSDPDVPPQRVAATFRRDNEILALKPDKDAMKRRAKLTLIGKVMTKKVIPRHVVRSVFAGIWNLKEPDSIALSINGHNIFTFTFNHESDRKKSWDRRPWSINEALMVLKAYNPNMLPQNMNFNEEEF